VKADPDRFGHPNPKQGVTRIVYSGSRAGGAVLSAKPALRLRRARARRVGPRIAALSVSDSPRTFTQREVLERLGLAGDEFAERIFARCGVERRHLELSDEFMACTLQGRTARIERDLLAHSIEAVQALGLDPRAVGTVVSASLYSLGCPTLAHRVADRCGMDPAADRYHLSGVGCASAVPLMRLAGQSLHESPDRTALVLAAESMSGIITRAAPGDPRAKVVGAAIFGDGCAAALLTGDTGAEGPAILASKVHQLKDPLGRDTLDAVSLRCTDDDSHLHLTRELPYLAGDALGGLVEEFLRANDVGRSEIDHWIVHPGGRRIIENMQSALGLGEEEVALSWEVLADHGNLGTPSIFYVLKETIARRAPEPGEHGLMVTIGPGVTVGLMLLGW
jgi:alkylresorcinol/alkylpyrone synthase